ncbi:hypothetical protein KFL_003270130 [Klebsormidium nitens]|uniref:LysM domain-containing protein n=1 Tax=Klebsormidium nitens TaxID=105231 RepID=A0A1Y1IEC1_KLENI|nr:hypothetical protein KFL_003270130 [Klebsormidium nitens]|eukprot:GAQ87046.1 hypothetical protein KFL_003270130 [Klebsormidium nitens]
MLLVPDLVITNLMEGFICGPCRAPFSPPPATLSGIVFELESMPVVGDGTRSAKVFASVSERDRKGLDRVASLFSYGSLGNLVSAVGSGGLLRRVQQLAANEFLNQSRAQNEGLRRERDAARQEVFAAQKEKEAASELAGKWQSVCGELEETGKARLAEVQHELWRCKADLDDINTRFETASKELRVAKKELTAVRKAGGAQKAVIKDLREKQSQRTKQEKSKVWLKAEIARLSQKLSGQERGGAVAVAAIGPLGKRRRKARVLNPARRAQNDRNTKVREALVGALAKVRDAVGTGENPREDEKRALEAVAKALAVKSGKKLITAHPELLVPERVGKKLREEGEKEVVAWMRNPARWLKMMDVGDISFSRADKLTVAFPLGSKPPNKDIILEKKVLNAVMQQVNPISPTPGGNGHQFGLARGVELVLPLWLDEMKKAGKAVRVNWDTKKGKILIAWTMDARTRNHRDFNTLVFLAKEDGLEFLWQSRRWVFTHAEIRGKDNRKNIEGDLKPALQEVQELYNGKTITIKLRDPETLELVAVEMTFKVLIPGDMSMHWSLFQEGGGRGGRDARPCGRCNCTKEDLGKAFERYEIKEGETLEEISIRLRYSSEFLREINPPLTNPMELVYRKFQKPLPAPAQPEPPVQPPAKRKKKGGPPPPPQTVEWAPTISLDRDSLPDDKQPIGAGFIRVFIRWAMNRECPHAFLKVEHEDAPFCSEHMTARVVENFLKWVHTRAQERAQVDEINARWKALKINYAIRKKPQGAGEGYKDPSCKGKVARDLLHKVEEWLPLLLKPGEDQILEIWQLFRRMVATARAYHPNQSQIQEFRTDAARLFVLHRLRLTDENFAYYIHTVCCHGYEYLLRWGLGRVMQEAVEAEHLDKDKIVEGTFQGGNPGNPYLRKSKGEDGRWHYDKDGPRKEMKKQHITEYVMQKTNRLLYYRLSHYWDQTWLADLFSQLRANLAAFETVSQRDVEADIDDDDELLEAVLNEEEEEASRRARDADMFDLTFAP